MGSGTKRKDNDKVLINVPQLDDADFGSGGHLDINKVCPITIVSMIRHSAPLPEGSPLDIRNKDIFYLNLKVGSLKSSQKEKISRCALMGFRYVGKVVNKNKKQYAVFTRE